MVSRQYLLVMTRDETLAMIGRLARIVAHDGHAAGLPPVQWEALRYLARANRFSRTPGALTAYLGATKGTVSQTLMALQRARLVDKSADPADRRAVRLELTAQGAAMLAPDEMTRFEQALAAIAPALQKSLHDGLASLLKARIAQDGGRPFGICRDCRHFAAGEGASESSHFCRLLKVPLTEADAGKICVEQQAA